MINNGDISGVWYVEVGVCLRECGDIDVGMLNFVEVG